MSGAVQGHSQKWPGGWGLGRRSAADTRQIVALLNFGKRDLKYGAKGV